MQTLPDVQSYADTRDMPINQVGVTKVPWSFRFSPTTNSTAEPQSTIGSVDMFVSLPAEQKGTHMSRFVQILLEHNQELNYSTLTTLFKRVQERLGASQVFGTLRFPFIVHRSAPVTGEPGMLRLDVCIEITLDEDSAIQTTVSGPATSLCPCSKEISAYGAHNQRCELKACVRFATGCEVGVDELFSMIEKAASCSVFPTLKRADEKNVTEAAYDNPKFVEDIVRDMAVILKGDDRIAWYCCSSENFESIHQHNAFARIESSAK